MRFGGGANWEVLGRWDPARIPTSRDLRTGNSGAVSSLAACRGGRPGRRSGRSTSAAGCLAAPCCVDLDAEDIEGGGRGSGRLFADLMGCGCCEGAAADREAKYSL